MPFGMKMCRAHLRSHEKYLQEILLGSGKDTKIRELMKAVIVKANRYYFTGNMKEHKDEIMNMEGYKYYFQKEVERVVTEGTIENSLPKGYKSHKMPNTRFR